MPVPLIIRVIAAAKEAIDWFSFANETFGALGLLKRTAVAGAIAAAVATPIAVAKHGADPIDPVVSAPAVSSPDKIQAARERAEREAPPVGKLPMPWEL